MRQGFKEKKIAARIAPCVIINRGVDAASVCDFCVKRFVYVVCHGH
jgi:hypothetical protein